MVEQVVKSPKATGRYYLKMVRKYVRIIAQLPGVAQELEGYLALTGSIVVTLLSLPLALLAVAMLAVGLASLPFRCCGQSGKRRATRCCFAVVPLAILLIASSASLGLLLGTGVASVCASPVETLVSYPGHIFGFDSRPFNVTRFYLQGKGELEALTNLGEANGLLSDLHSKLGQYSEGMAETCLGWMAAVGALEPNLKSVQDNLAGCRQLISPANIYPFFEQTVHGNLCGSTLRALSCSVLTQVAVGFFGLPMLVASAQNLLSQRQNDLQANEAKEMAIKKAWELELIDAPPSLLRKDARAEQVKPQKIPRTP